MRPQMALRIFVFKLSLERCFWLTSLALAAQRATWRGFDRSGRCFAATASGIQRALVVLGLDAAAHRVCYQRWGYGFGAGLSRNIA